ncbi:hypothetical protein K2173_010045 [Erythroxylum novogranatense]|uniref:Transmembrane protein n=1 Tax=Erythroxylum novogranatense TaxID=1862640 RepID=A0AAV8UD49_9ROSI|nr:hypothetical protein K2173_010045 [Erythroxylum novogranatense]
MISPVACAHAPCFLFQRGTNRALKFFNCQFLSSNSVLRLSLQSSLLVNKTQYGNSRSVPIVRASQSNFSKVALHWLLLVPLTVLDQHFYSECMENCGDGIEAGTNLVPDSVPRPIARISVTVVALAISLFVLKSFLSTAFFVLATMGLVYFLFIALNKDQRPRGDRGTSSPDDPLEEAKRIMEKYK